MTRNSNGFGTFLLRTWFVNRGRWNCAVVYLLVFCRDLWALRARWSRHNRNGAIHADSPSMRRSVTTPAVYAISSGRHALFFVFRAGAAFP